MDAELSKILNKFYAPYPDTGHSACVKKLIEYFDALRKKELSYERNKTHQKQDRTD